MSRQKNKQVILNIGIPGSGKTTWTTDFIDKNPGWVKVGRDEMRKMLRNSPVLDNKGENLVTSLIFECAKRSLMAGYNVIIDNTHCKLKYINQAIEKFQEMADIEFRYFGDMPVETCIERDSKREKKVGEAVIRKMHKDLLIMVDSFDFQPVKQKIRHRPDYALAWDDSLPDAVIFDVDGTLAHMDGKRSPFDWKAVGVDRVDNVIARQLKLHKDAGDKILVVSGRDGSCRNETTEWLTKHELYFDELLMRPEGDYRKDSIIKKEIFENYIYGKYNVILVYDDRDQVVETWRSLGLKCLQVEPGNF